MNIGRNLEKHKEQLKQEIFKNKIDIILLCELGEHINENCIKQYKLYYQNRPDRVGGGVAILVNHRYNSNRLNLSSFYPIEIIGVEVEIHQKIYNLFSIYIPPMSKNVTSNFVKERK
jgi:hypothetical protein